MLDIVIKNGLVVDGTGTPGHIADVAVKDGMIVGIGQIDAPATQMIDAEGRVVAPGFVDIHTHYDAQVFWDPYLTPSSNHGVTSIIGGNCGFSIAPMSPEAADYLVPMLARVEGMPLESLRQGVPWKWRSFAQYLSMLDGRVALNVGFMVGHSAVRRVVMGERAVGEHATEADLAEMVALVRRSVDEGAMGFSTTISISHNDADGNPVPSRHASREELIALAGAIRDLPATAIEFLPGAEPFDEDRKQLMTDLSLAANRPLNWNALAVSANNGDQVHAFLSASDFARARGAEVLALTVPTSSAIRINLVSGFVYDMIAGWSDFFRCSLEERMHQLRDPKGRQLLRQQAFGDHSYFVRQITDFDNTVVAETFADANQRYAGRRLGDFSTAERDAFDLFCDVALADDLRTSFAPQLEGTGDVSDAAWRAKGAAWLDDRTVIGASDAGAHLDMIDSFAIPTRLLEHGVREQGLLSLEEAVRQLTEIPARLYGLRGRGRLAEGWHADIVLFDAERVRCAEVHTRFDLPTGAGRIFAAAEGIDHLIVNGQEVMREQEPTGRLAGTVLRSGRDTDPVSLQTRRSTR